MASIPARTSGLNRARRFTTLGVVGALLAAFFVALSAPSASAVARLQQSRGIWAEGIGRAGGNIEFDIYSKLANGSTSSTDVLYAWIEGRPAGSSVSNAINNTYGVVTNAPVSNSIQHAHVSLPIDVVGNYSVRFCATASGFLPAGTSGDPYYWSSVGAPTGGDWTYIRYCDVRTVVVGGAPTLISTGERTLYSGLTSSSQASTPVHVGLFDAAGRRTLLAAGESLAISLSSGQLSASSAVSGGALPQSLSITSNSAVSSVGTYVFYAGNSSAATSSISIAGGGTISGLDSASVALDTRSRGALSGRTPNLVYSQNGSFGTGSDGNLYRWGYSTAGMSDNVSGVDLLNKTLLKPTKADISAGVRATKLWNCWQMWGSSCYDYGFLAEDGSVWIDGEDGNVSIPQRLAGTFEPMILPFSSALRVVDISFEARVLVLSDGSVWRREGFTYSKQDLSTISAPKITSVIYLWASDTTIMLAENGDVYSVGGNAQGQLGQGSDNASTLGKVALAAGKQATKIIGGRDWAGALLAGGGVVTWGSNSTGQQGKSATEIPYLNAPRTLVTPGEVSVTRVEGLDRGVVVFGSTASKTQTAYYAHDGVWNEANFGDTSVPVSENIAAVYFDSSVSRKIVVTTDFKVYQAYLATGNCDNTNGRIRSDGAFGPVWQVDPLQYGTRLLISGSNVTNIPDVVSVMEGDTFTIQAANVRTKCYGASELTYAWDRDGNGTFETPDTPVLGDTGYLAVNGTFNFSSAGRYTIGLGVTNSDGVTQTMPIVVGVDPLVRPTISIPGESVTVSSNWTTAIAIGSDRKVYTWGSNNEGHLGLPASITSTPVPTQVVLPVGVVPSTVSSSQWNSFVVDTTGAVWISGKGYLLNNTDSNNYAMTRMTSLASMNIVDIHASNNGWRAIALTSSGQIIGIGRNYAPRVVGGFAGLIFKQIAMATNFGYALTTAGDVYQIYMDENGYQVPTKIVELSNVKKIQQVGFYDEWNTPVTAITETGDVYFRRTGNDANIRFQKVTLPSSVTTLSASAVGSGGLVFAMDSQGSVWQTTVTQSANVDLQQTPWVKFTSAALGKLNSADSPKFVDNGGWFIGFNSGRIMRIDNEWTMAGRCGVSWEQSANAMSVGQFGPAFNVDSPVYLSNLKVASGANASRDWNDGGSLGVDPGVDLTFKLSGLRTNCFNPGVRFQVSADLDGSGNFATPLDVSNDGGNATVQVTTSAQLSGKRTFAFRVTTPLGAVSTFSLNVGVYSNTPSSAVTSRKPIYHTGGNTTTAPGSDNKIYIWGTQGSARYLVNSTPPKSSNQPMEIQFPDTRTVRDAVMLGNNSDAVILAVDGSGKTFVWATRSGVNLAASAYAAGSVPTTPTEIPALVGADVVRIDASEGNRGLALTSGGVVYEWGDGNGRVPFKVAGLAGITIVDIWASDNVNMALSSTGDLYTWRAQGDRLGWSTASDNYWRSAYWLWDPNSQPEIQKVPVGEAIKSVGNSPSGVLLIGVSNKFYFFGQAQAYSTYRPVQKNLPGSRVPAVVGNGPGNYGTVIATDGTWWQLGSDANDQLSFVRYNDSAVEDANGLVHSGVTAFARGTGRGVIKSDGSLITYSGQGGPVGTCGPTSSTFTKVLSTGQLGPIFRDDSAITTGLKVAVGAGPIQDWTDGGSLAVDPGTLTFTFPNMSTNCFNGDLFQVRADLDGSGSFATTLDISTDGGNSTAQLTMTTPASGKRTIAFRITTPFAASVTYSLTLGVYSTTPNVLVTSHKPMLHTGDSTSSAPGSDNKIYIWGVAGPARLLVNPTPPKSSSQAMEIQFPDTRTVRDAVMLGNGSEAAVLVVDGSGKTYAWATRPGVNFASSTYQSGSLPITPTEIPALVGADVVRIDATNSRGLALTSGGVVWEWGDGNNRVPFKVAGLAGITIVDIWASDMVNMALSSTGDLYTWRGQNDRLGWTNDTNNNSWQSAPWTWDPSLQVQKVPFGETIKSVGMTPNGVIAIGVSNKLYFFGQSQNFVAFRPVQKILPGGRLPYVVGNGPGNYGTIIATDGTWWQPSSDSNDQLVLVRYNDPAVDDAAGLVHTNVVGFARGNGRGMIKSDGTLITYGGPSGTCGTNYAYNRVMSNGQLGPIFKDDSLNIWVTQSTDPIRPNVPVTMSLSANSNCNGGEALTISADLTGTGVFTNPTPATVAEDGMSASSSFTFTKTKSGFIEMKFKVTSADSLTATTTFNARIVPLPPAGRLIGISINGGARYTNSQNVFVDLVWPDGVTSITVSNDGGFAPGTFRVVDVQEHIEWQLPPQAVIPLPAIVYTRFGDSTTYFFDDIIVDSIAPVLTYVAAS